MTGEDTTETHDQANGEAPPEPSVPGLSVAVRDQGTAVKEIGGPKGPEPTRFGDWEQGGRCTDF